MSIPRGLLVLACAALGACAQGDLSPAVPEGSPDPGAAREQPRVLAVPGEYLVKFRTPDRDLALNALDETSFRSMKTYTRVPGLHLVKIAAGADGIAASAALARRRDVEYVEPNFYAHATAIPNDPRFVDQWGLLSPGSFGGVPEADIDATTAWNITTGSEQVVIAVIDSGVDYRHEDLSANMFSNPGECTADGIDNDGNGYIDDCHGIDVVDHDSDPDDVDGHGTHVAGILGAEGNNGIGIAGVAWTVRMLPCRFLDATGKGTLAGALECFDYIAALRARGVNIVASNNSWGQRFPSRALDEAILEQRQHGMLVIASGSNAGDIDAFPHFPCSSDLSNVICVGASSLDGLNTLSWGKRTLLVQAPGRGIWSTVPGNQYYALDGTSMATPHVSGTIALLASQEPSRDWRALRNLVIAGADPHQGLRPLYNTAHLNAAGSLACANRTVTKRLKPAALEPVSRSPGTRLPLSVLHVNCAQPAGPLAVTVDQTGEAVLLQDDGVDGDEVANDGIYTGAWTVAAAGTYNLRVNGSTEEGFEVRSVAELKPGFPLKLMLEPNEFVMGWPNPAFGVVVGNIAGDAQPEIIAPSLLYGPLNAWHHDGTAVPGWPSYEVFTQSMPALGELDGDPALSEIVVNFALEGIRPLSPLGTTMPGWPKSPGAGSGFPPPLADLDSDGRDEVVMFPAHRADGTPFVGQVPIPATPVDPTDANPPAIADLDGDGRLDVISAGQEFIYAVSATGELPGFPVRRKRSERQRAEIAVGDVDGDGELEIVATEMVRTNASSDAYTFIDVYSHRGVKERRIEAGQLFRTGEPVLGDLDGDGIPEIIVSGDRKVSAFKGDGTPVQGWPFHFPEGEGGLPEPLVGDITGDGRPDVVIQAATDNYVYSDFSGWIQATRLYALHADGRVVEGFPRPLTVGITIPGSTIADIDRDGRNEFIAVMASGFGYREALFAWDFATGPGGPIEWASYRGGPDRRAYYETGKNLPAHAYLAVRAQGSGSVSGDGIDCGDDCIQRYAKGTSILLTATPSPGATFEGWTGDCSGQSVTCTVQVNRYTSATARFSSTVSIRFEGSGAGTVVSTPAGLDCTSDCTHLFPGGSGITLVATPAAGADFDGWSGACTGFQPECRVAADGNVQVVASFTTSRRLFTSITGDGRGMITSQPAGISCDSECSAIFPKDSSVVLTAVADPDSYVWAWSAPCQNLLFGTTQCTVTMDESKSVSVLMARKKRITVELVGNGGGTVASMPDGMTCTGQQCTMLARNGETVQLRARPAADSEFTGWTGNCSGFSRDCTVLVFNADASITASFTLRTNLRLLQVAIAGAGNVGKVIASAGGIDCGQGFSQCGAYLAADTQVTLTAQWGANGTFTGWSGACAGTAPTCTITMDEAKSVSATFEAFPVTHTLGVTIGGNMTSLGKVVSSPAGIDCGMGAGSCQAALAEGSTVTLTVVPASNAQFTGWAGNCSGVVSTCQLTMTSPRQVVANFEEVTGPPPPLLHSLQVTLTGPGSGRITSSTGGISCGQGATACSAAIPDGTSVTLTASAAPGAQFSSWSGACSGASSTCTVVMTAPRNVGVAFGVVTTPPPPPPPPPPPAEKGGGGSAGVLALSGLLLLLLGRCRQQKWRLRPSLTPQYSVRTRVWTGLTLRMPTGHKGGEPMLTATPKCWLSSNLAVAGSNGHLADIAMSMWREKGTLTVAGRRYAVYRKRPMSGLFILQSDRGTVATAEKPSVWSQRLLIEHAASQYELKRRSMFSRTFDLHGSDGAVGSISARNMFTRGMNIDLPDSLPLPVRLFIVWLVAILWNREAAAAAG